MVSTKEGFKTGRARPRSEVLGCESGLLALTGLLVGGSLGGVGAVFMHVGLEPNS